MDPEDFSDPEESSESEKSSDPEESSSSPEDEANKNEDGKTTDKGKMLKITKNKAPAAPFGTEGMHAQALKFLKLNRDSIKNLSSK